MPVVLAAAVLASCSGADWLGDAFSNTAVTCGTAVLDAADVGALPTLDSLPDAVLGAVDDTGTPVVDRSLDWRIGSMVDEWVVLVREYDPAEPAAAAGDTHGVLELGPSGADDEPWFAWAQGSCSVRDAGGDVAELRLAAQPAPTDTEIVLLVAERACAGGATAEGRVEVDELTLRVDVVELRVRVRPLRGDQTCEGNPWTPFPVELGEALGDRVVVDASFVPPRPIEVEPGFGVLLDGESDPTQVAVEQALAFDVWPNYTLVVETTCACDAGVYEVVVRDGVVVRRRFVEGSGVAVSDAVADPDPVLAPSLGELLDLLGRARANGSSAVLEATLDEGGVLRRLTYDPTPSDDAGVITHALHVEVDSPGDPLPGR